MGAVPLFCGFLYKMSDIYVAICCDMLYNKQKYARRCRRAVITDREEVNGPIEAHF